MKRSAPRIIVPALFILIILVALAMWLLATKHPENKYIGPKPKLTTPSQSTRFQIDDAVLNVPPAVPQGVQADMRITAFTASAAKGYVSYSKNRPTMQFMAVKKDDKWIVIKHTTDKKLPLPDATTAEKYNLPAGWYSAN